LVNRLVLDMVGSWVFDMVVLMRETSRVPRSVLSD